MLVDGHCLTLLRLHCVQVCGEGYVLDLQLPSGPPHVVMLSLLLLLAELRGQSAALLTPAANGAAKVLLRLPVQVSRTCTRHGCGCA